ncbi:MAG TPA: hypothetical protein VG056_05560 [Pirellulales bacterium]|jgi:hypothetical protein|nr:hypothetical protein [Pirellulales bacterium]
MKKLLLCGVAAVALSLCGLTGMSSAEVPFPYIYRHSLYMPWHGAYADAEYGEPIALVVPPTAAFKTEYHWGVGGKRVVPIYHQFGRPYPGPIGYVGNGFLPTPAWPNDTTQFGVYPIRGPW